MGILSARALKIFAWIQMSQITRIIPYLLENKKINLPELGGGIPQSPLHRRLPLSMIIQELIPVLLMWEKMKILTTLHFACNLALSVTIMKIYRTRGKLGEVYETLIELRPYTLSEMSRMPFIIAQRVTSVKSALVYNTLSYDNAYPGLQAIRSRDNIT